MADSHEARHIKRDTNLSKSRKIISHLNIPHKTSTQTARKEPGLPTQKHPAEPLTSISRMNHNPIINN